MSLSRRKFLGLTLKGVLVIGAGNIVKSFAASSFKLPDAKDVLLRFALVSDGHYGQPNTNFDFHHDNMIAWLNKEHAERGVEFTILNGDTFHNEPDRLAPAKKKWEDLKMPLYVSHGNHDQVDEDTWQKAWGYPLNYTFEKGDDIAFIVLDTATVTGEYVCPNAAWTKAQLAKYKDKKHLFVIMHITPVKWTGAGIDCPDIVAMFSSQQNLKAVFHGHDHDQDNVKETGGKHYFFDSHIAGDWGTEYRGYRIVEVLKNGDILTYQMDGKADTKVNENTVPV
ncbi:MAG TPA: metallophosphoesterase [Chitinophagaceae bacterium]|nr:metallophosphoesterase [Chitinophagaceae bacterium]